MSALTNYSKPGAPASAGAGATAPTAGAGAGTTGPSAGYGAAPSGGYGVTGGPGPSRSSHDGSLHASSVVCAAAHNVVHASCGVRGCPQSCAHTIMNTRMHMRTPVMRAACVLCFHTPYTRGWLPRSHNAAGALCSQQRKKKPLRLVLSPCPLRMQRAQLMTSGRRGHQRPHWRGRCLGIAPNSCWRRYVDTVQLP